MRYQSVQEMFENTLEIVRDEMTPELEAAGLSLADYEIGSTVVDVLFVGDGYGLVICVDFHDHSILTCFVRQSASVKSGCYLNGGVYVAQVIADSDVPTRKRDQRTVNSQVNPFDPMKLRARLQEIRPILLTYLSLGRQAIVSAPQ